MIENPKFLYEGSLSSEDDMALDASKKGNNFDFGGFKDGFLGSSSEDEKEDIKPPPPPPP